MKAALAREGWGTKLIDSGKPRGFSQPLLPSVDEVSGQSERIVMAAMAALCCCLRVRGCKHARFGTLPFFFPYRGLCRLAMATDIESKSTYAHSARSWPFPSPFLVCG